MARGTDYQRQHGILQNNLFVLSCLIPLAQKVYLTIIPILQMWKNKVIKKLKPTLDYRTSKKKMQGLTWSGPSP